MIARTIALAVAGGLLIALSVPPAGFWPLGIVGVALLFHLLRDQPGRRRALIGFAGGMGLYGVTIFWFAEFNAIGAVLSMMVEASFLALAAFVSRPGWRVFDGLSFVGALVLSDWLRTYFPFGGVPLGGIPLGQADGPLAPAARLGGQLLVTGVVGLLAVALVALVWAVSVAGSPASGSSTAGGRRRRPVAAETAGGRRRRPVAAETAGGRRRRLVVAETAGGRGRRLVAAGAALAVVVALPVLGRAAPSGHSVGTIQVAAVQGGGRRGLRAIHNSAAAVLQAQFNANRLVRLPVDLILWPEDVITLDGPIELSPVANQVGALAVADHAALLAGVVEDAGPAKFRNAQVVWDGTGRITGRYDKVHRVPFGEYIPGRFLIKHLVSLDVIPRDAIAGTGSGAVDTQAGRMGIVISFEVFFPARARSAIRAGGQVLLAPTNTASYTTTQVAAAEVAAERLRAWETGRDVVMAAPTGWSSVVDSRGRLLQRSGLGSAQVLEATVHRRTGSTPYVRWGDLPVVLLGFALLAAAWAPAARRATIS